MKRTATLRPRSAARGAAALVVVMVLFFIMSLVAAYASRNLIFEQRTSANNNRATKAFEAAEAGLEWAIAMLNGGRIDGTCEPTIDGVSTPLRARYLQPLGGGNIGIRPSPADTTPPLIRAACVRIEPEPESGSGWECSCPDPNPGTPALTAPAGSTPAAAFRIGFEAVPGQPNLVKIWSRGCSNLGSECDAAIATRADATSEVNALVGLAPALVQPPAASLTVRGGLDPGSATVVADVPDAVAVNSGGAVAPAILDANLQGPPGSPLAAVRSRLIVEGDATLAVAPLSGALTAGERFFLATFGVAPDALRLQPAVHRLTCGTECRGALQDAARDYPGRILWVDDNLNIGAGTLTLGSAAAPAILVVNGNLDFDAGSNVTIHGLVYSRGTQLDATDAAVTIQGAFIAEGDPDTGSNAGHFTIVAAPQLRFDADLAGRVRDVIAREVLDFGSFTRVPGSWRDFR